MTYAANEKSVASGAPFECYRFETPMGTFRYTSLPFAVTLGTGDGAQTFDPCPGIDRTTAEINSVVDSLQTMDFVIPREDDLARRYNQKNLPDYCTTRVYRAHWGDDLTTQFEIEWRGEATDYSYRDGALIISTQSILQAKIQGSQCTIYTQLSCNHRVYDARCGVNKGDHTASTTVTDIDNVSIEVANQTFSNVDLQLGEMRNTRTGEARTIFQAASGLITVTYPFTDLVVGDTVELSRGCNNLMSTCIARFNNVERFLGFRYIPTTNIFVNSGDKTVVQTTSNRNLALVKWTVAGETVRR